MLYRLSKLITKIFLMMHILKNLWKLSEGKRWLVQASMNGFFKTSVILELTITKKMADVATFYQNALQSEIV